jgi:hypothetical protein
MASENTPDSSGRSQRKALRYSFVATAELTETVSATCLTGRIGEISRNGCYLDILNTFPVGTLLKLQISCDQGTFHTKAKIVYVHPNIGMGVAFLDPAPDQLKLLDGWIAAFPPESVI